jgi:hypothetical protein
VYLFDPHIRKLTRCSPGTDAAIAVETAGNVVLVDGEVPLPPTIAAMPPTSSTPTTNGPDRMRERRGRKGLRGSKRDGRGVNRRLAMPAL